MKIIPLLSVTTVLLLALIAVPTAGQSTFIQADAEAKIAYMNPVWSPDGRSIAYVSIPYVEDPVEPTAGKTGKNVHLATLTGGAWRHRLLAKDADWPIWSRDGKQLAFSQGGLAVMDIASGRINVLKKNEGGAIYYPLSWSPNGRYIIYTSAHQDSPSAVVFDTRTGRDLGITAGIEATWTADNKILSSLKTDENIWFRLTDPTNGNFQVLLKDRYAQRPYSGAGFAWVWMTENTTHGEGLYRYNLRTGVLGKEIGVRADEVYWGPAGKRFAFLAKFAQKRGDEPQPYLYVGNTTNWAFQIAGRRAASPNGHQHDRMRYVNWQSNESNIAYVTEIGNINIVKL